MLCGVATAGACAGAAHHDRVALAIPTQLPIGAADSAGTFHEGSGAKRALQATALQYEEQAVRMARFH